MRKFLAPAVLAVSLLTACVPAILSTRGGSSSTSLGPDGVAASADVSSTLPARIKAGVEWLWASYTALQAKGLDVSSLREAISEMQDVVQYGDLTAALSLYSKARTIVTEIAQ